MIDIKPLSCAFIIYAILLLITNISILYILNNSKLENKKISKKTFIIMIVLSIFTIPLLITPSFMFLYGLFVGLKIDERLSLILTLSISPSLSFILDYNIINIIRKIIKFYIKNKNT